MLCGDDIWNMNRVCILGFLKVLQLKCGYMIKGINIMYIFKQKNNYSNFLEALREEQEGVELKIKLLEKKWEFRISQQS